jgi:hypothetical protein
MSELFDFLRIPEGRLEVIVQDHKTREILYKKTYKNQIQDWLKHALAYMSAGRMFCTWGHHGETYTDTPLVPRVDHYIDGSNTQTENTTPFIYNAALAGLIQKRDAVLGDINEGTVADGTELFPFFPTKMRFGTAGLDADLQPITEIPTDKKNLNAEQGNPFVVIDRARDTDHITISRSGGVTNNKVTFSVKLPGGDPSYPYNGKVLSEAGLYCDAALRVGENDLTMRTGMLLAYRTFHGITKDESSDITFNWSWQF